MLHLFKKLFSLLTHFRFLNQACAWLLEVTLMQICMRACVCTLPRLFIAIGMILILYDYVNAFCYFSVYFTVLAVNVIDRNGPSNIMFLQLQLKKAKVMLYHLFI